MGLQTTVTSILGKLSGKGNFIGKSKSGIAVYRKITKDGKVITSSYKNGKPFKKIVREIVPEYKVSSFVPYSANGHRTVAQNFETGVTTQISNLKVNYTKPYSQFNHSFHAGIRNEFSVGRYAQVNGETVQVGNAYGRISAPNFLRESRLRVGNNQSYFMTTTTRSGDANNYRLDKYIDVKDFEMPNGRTVTGELGRRNTHWTYADGHVHKDSYSLNEINVYGGPQRKHIPVMTTAANGKVNVEYKYV